MVKWWQLSLCFMLMSFGLSAEVLTKVSVDKIDAADFYLLDIVDESSRVASSIDAYVIDGTIYIAVSPMLNGLRVNHTFDANLLTIVFNQQPYEFSFSEAAAESGTSINTWFNDGVFYFLPAPLFEQTFGTNITLKTESLVLSLSGHTVDFPHKKIKVNQLQRQGNEYLTGSLSDPNLNRSASVITVPDQYRLATVPNGFANLNYSHNGTKGELNGVVQSVSDLAYHSALVTLTKTDDDLLSFMRLSRSPTKPGDKFLGIWDSYNFGDIYSRSAALSNNESRGLGISLNSNFIENYHQNFTTSFTEVGKPGWEADIFHNGRFLETRAVPDDGILEFNDIEVYYGSNEFKIVLFGPYGDQETIIRNVDVRRTPLAKGDTSFDISFLEQDSSLLDINLDEFDIDSVAGSFRYGVLDNWMVGVSSSIADIHSENGPSETYTIINQISFPNWFIDNTLSFANGAKSQNTNIATSIFSNDSLVFNYRSNWGENTSFSDPSDYQASLNYNFLYGRLGNNFSVIASENGVEKVERLQHRINFYGKSFNIANTLIYQKVNDEEEIEGRIDVSRRLGSNLRMSLNIPYEPKADEPFKSDQISASVNYYFKTEATRHNIRLSASSLFEDNIWTLGYNFAMNKPTHQLTFGTAYDSNDNWRIRAGVVFNFGYDYYNDSMYFTHRNIQAGGTLDVYSYLDRRLNGIPDVLDYDLAGVTFSGNPLWENTVTNEQGKARLFGVNAGIVPLTASWNSGGKALNQDYLIYSHAGSQHSVNLPFYLYTELEFFVSLSSNNTLTELSAVPVTAKNLSTGDSYQIDSDYDGYVNFTDLLPGQYEVKLSEEWLKQQGFDTNHLGFKFEAPLTGGFLILPNIELTREATAGSINSSLFEVKLDESNFEPIIDSENDKLIHLPPKGGFKAPYSFDDLSVWEFKRIRQNATKEQRTALRQKLASALLTRNENDLGVKQGQVLVASATENSQSYLLSIGGFQTLAQAKRFADQRGLTFSTHQGLSQQGEVIYFVQLARFGSFKAATEHAQNEFAGFEYRIGEVEEERRALTGWVVQYAATKSLDKTIAQADKFDNSVKLHIVRKRVNEDVWYCLVSEEFIEKVQAGAALEVSGKQGFIVPAQNFIDTVWSK